MKTTIKYQIIMGVAKAKDSVEGRNAFYAVFLYVQKNRTFAKKNSLCYNVGEGGQAI